MSSTNGAVVLGRQLILNLDGRHHKLLLAMAKKYGMSGSQFAELLLLEAVDRAAREGIAGQLVMALTMLWCSGRAA